MSTGQVASLTVGGAEDACWTDERNRVLIAAVDSLHDSSDLSVGIWNRLRSIFDEGQVLDLLMLTG